MTMKKIGTHNSATGENGYGVLSWLVAPFAVTQRKTICEQFDAGCRSFDIRVRLTKRGWVCAHGLWESLRSAEDILKEIDCLGDRVEVSVMYEGKGHADFGNFATMVRTHSRNIVWGKFCCKKSRTVYQYADPSYSGGKQGFVVLDGRSWHTYLPSPWLWNLIYTRKKKFDEEKFTFVDFL